MLTPEQSRAARGWLDWSQDELAKRAHVSLSTVRDFEKGRRTPIANNLDAMRKAIESQGIRLLFDAEIGVGIEFDRPVHSASSDAAKSKRRAAEETVAK